LCSWAAPPSVCPVQHRERTPHQGAGTAFFRAHLKEEPLHERERVAELEDLPGDLVAPEGFAGLPLLPPKLPEDPSQPPRRVRVDVLLGEELDPALI